MSDELELRLRDLSRSMTLRSSDREAMEHLHPGGRQSRTGSRLAVAAATLLVAILVANVVAAYFAPKYQVALADSGLGPASQRFFAAVGLSDRDLTSVNDAATSSGHTVRLVAGYADGLRTNFFLMIDGKGLTGNPKEYGRNPSDLGVVPWPDGVTLTDQFGRGYQATGVTGPTDLQFQPLGWPASEVGGRLTLHITALTNYARNATVIQGDWTLHATLISSPVHNLPPPGPVQTPQANYTFTGISATETEMVVQWTVSGPVIGQLAKYQNAPGPVDLFSDPLFDQYLRPHVYDEAGTELQFQEFGYSWPKGPAEGGATVFIKGPGRYRIQIGTVAAATWVDVP